MDAFITAELQAVAKGLSAGSGWVPSFRCSCDAVLFYKDTPVCPVFSHKPDGCLNLNYCLVGCSVMLCEGTCLLAVTVSVAIQCGM